MCSNCSITLPSWQGTKAGRIMWRGKTFLGQVNKQTLQSELSFTTVWLVRKLERESERESMKSRFKGAFLASIIFLSHHWCLGVSYFAFSLLLVGQRTVTAETTVESRQTCVINDTWDESSPGEWTCFAAGSLSLSSVCPPALALNQNNFIYIVHMDGCG